MSPRRVGLFALGVVVLMVLVGVASNAEQFTTPGTQTGQQRSILPIEQDLAVDGDESEIIRQRSEPVELPESVVITIAAIAGLGLLYLLSRQRMKFRLSRPSVKFAKTAVEVTEEEQADAIATMADDLIIALRDGDSPRVAIQRAYAAVETGFGAQELARKAAETPLRYLDRIFGRHKAVREPLAELTRLFQQARFSDAPVSETMRTEAIEALTGIRDYYQAFAWKKIARRRSKATT